MSTATAGELFAAAADRLHSARQHAYQKRDLGHLASAISEAARVADVLRRYLADVITGNGIQPLPVNADSTAIYLAIHANEALRLAAGHLTTAGNGIRPSGTAPGRDPLTPDIATAADHLTAGHDLLRTHFISEADGTTAPASRRSAVVTCRAVTAALLKEISSQTHEVWRLTVGLSSAVMATSTLPDTVPIELDHANRWLAQARVLLNQVPGHGHADFPGRLLLQAIPANRVPEPQPLTAPETLTDLCQGIAISAERLHAVAFNSRDASGSPKLTAESWKWTAAARVVTADATEILLRSLAERAQVLPADPFAKRLLAAAAEAAASTRERWGHVTSAWARLTTDAKGLTAPDLTDSSDLLIRLGRLAFDNQHWTPTRGLRSAIRDPAALAPAPDQVLSVLAAVHQAVDALASLASTDEQNIHAAVDAKRIYIPARLLYEREDTACPYQPADTTDLIKTYTSAAAASAELAVALDAAALALDAPSQTITAARMATRPGQETMLAGQSPLLTPAPPRHVAPPQPGPVEQRLRQINIDNDILLQRAKAIDTAGWQLVAEAEAEASQLKDARQAAKPRRPETAGSDQSPAGQNFPLDAAWPTTGRPAADSPQQAQRATRPPRRQRH